MTDHPVKNEAAELVVEASEEYRAFWAEDDDDFTPTFEETILASGLHKQC